jgi:biofilm PGA synthesis N-glycosyltransferase PgaC
LITFWTFIIILCTLYLLLIGSFLFGWNRIKEFNKTGVRNQPFLSVVIPIRNESSSIENLLTDLSLQDYPEEKFEVILVDDHSNDFTLQLINQFNTNIKCRIIQLGDHEYGKKAALIKGLKASNSDLVLTTDGDCRLKKYWISEMAEFYSSRPAKLIFGPVLFSNKKTFWNKMQSLEFLSLVTGAAGLAGIHRPILCNAANMGFDRKSYLRFANHHPSEIVSGDDIFYLHWLKKKYPDEIHFLKSHSSFVVTTPPENPRDFIGQRIRWTSKSRYYRDCHLILTALIIFIVSFSLLCLLAGSIFCKLSLQGFLLLFIIKGIADFIFLHRITSFFHIRHLLRVFIPLEFVYFFYVSIIGIAGNLFSFSWKGRKINRSN